MTTKKKTLLEKLKNDDFKLETRKITQSNFKKTKWEIIIL